MNQTNLLAVLALASFTYTNTIRTTNWIETGNTEHRDGTNYVEKWISGITTIDQREVVTPTLVWVTNPVPIRITREVFSLTNTVKTKVTKGPAPMPLAPSFPSKL